MSATIQDEKISSAPQVKHAAFGRAAGAPQVRIGEPSAPVSIPRDFEFEAPRRQVKKKAKKENLAVALTVRFCAVTLVTVAVSSLLGQIRVESVRRELAGVQARIRSASRMANDAHSRVARLESDSAIEDWAHAHGYTAPELSTSEATTHTVVAMNEEQ